MTATPAPAVRRMTVADAQEVGELLVLSFPDKLCAWVFMTVFHAVSPPGDELSMNTVAVHPARRRRGVGDALMRFVEAEARRRRRSLSLYCIRRNPGAHAPYRRRGYRVVRAEDSWWCSPCWACASAT